MGVVEVGQSLSFSAGETTLHLDGYGDQFSAYWTTDSELYETLSVFDSVLDIHPDSKVVIEKSEQTEDTQYADFLHLETGIEDTDAEFVSIYADRCVLSWEMFGEDYRVGISSNFDIHEPVVNIFERTTDTRVSPDDRQRISEFVSENV